MQFVNHQLINSINERFCQVQNFVTLTNASGFQDFNRGAEDFFCRLLNQIYGYNLSNLNLEKKNFPAIDLGDKGARISFQITAEGSNSKLKDTVEKFDKYNFKKDYSKVVLLVISTAAPPKPLRYPGIEVEVWNIGSLAARISLLDDGTLRAIENIFETSLISSVNDEPSILGNFSPHANTVGSCSKFLTALGYQPQDEELLGVRLDIQLLADKFNVLTRKEKEFLYLIAAMGRQAHNYSGYPDENNYYVPCSTLAARLGNTETWSLFYSLNHHGLVKLEEEYSEDCMFRGTPHFGIKFYNSTGDFNFFPLLLKFLRTDGERKQLLLNNDFSCLG